MVGPLGVPRAPVHMRMGMAQLSGHIRDSGVGHCLLVLVEDFCRSSDEALVC